MLARNVFLGFSAFLWLSYGIFCFLQPSFLEQAAGLVGNSATAVTEIRAMYGGLEVGIGAFCAVALVRSSLVRPALLMLCFLLSGLAGARLAGLVLDGSASGYTLGALGFEIASAVIALVLVQRRPETLA